VEFVLNVRNKLSIKFYSKIQTFLSFQIKYKEIIKNRAYRSLIFETMDAVRSSQSHAK